MKRTNDMRSDAKTAAHLSQALRLQSQFGHERAYSYLRALGVDAQLAQRVLAVRFERRRSALGLQGIAESSADWGLAVRVP